MRRLWIVLLAKLNLSDAAVCEASRGMGLVDYHDYTDGIVGQPWHFYEHTCRRCGKKFTI